MLKQLILFALVYTLTFTSYYFLTSFLNIIYPNEAFISFALFYGVYGVGSLFVPLIIDKINFRLGLFLSSFTFLIFVSFSSSYISAMMLVGSFIAGLGNSTIWVYQGKFTSKYNGYYIGIFYAIFNINMIFGNLLGLIVLLAGASIQIILFILIGISASGCVLTLLIKYPEVTQVNTQVNVDTQVDTQVNAQIHKINLNVFKIITKCYLFIPMFIAQSIGLNITFQIIPKLLLNYTEGDVQLKSIYNTIIFLSYGVSAIIFSLISGKIFDKNWKFVLIPYSILEVCCCVSLLLLAKFNNIQGYYILIGFVRGMIDYSLNNSINISLSKYEQKDINELFAFYRFVYAISYLIISICIGYIQYEIILLLNGIFAVLATIFYFFVKFPVISIEEQFTQNTFKIVK